MDLDNLTSTPGWALRDDWYLEQRKRFGQVGAPDGTSVDTLQSGRCGWGWLSARLHRVHGDAEFWLILTVIDGDTLAQRFESREDLLAAHDAYADHGADLIKLRQQGVDFWRNPPTSARWSWPFALRVPDGVVMGGTIPAYYEGPFTLASTNVGDAVEAVGLDDRRWLLKITECTNHSTGGDRWPMISILDCVPLSPMTGGVE